MSDGTIRVATYNTRDFLDDRAAAARVVRSIGPDVLCLQEVPRRLFAAARVSAFAAACGMDWAGHHRGSGGTAIFTSPRVQLVVAAHRRLRVRLGVRRRGYAVASVRLPGHLSIRVVSVHLSLDPEQRQRHVRQLLGELGALGRTVIAGDLNEEAGGAAYAVLASVARRADPAAPTFPTGNPDRSLDVVFVSPDLTARAGRTVALDEQDVQRATDHRPVWVEVEVAETGSR